MATSAAKPPPTPDMIMAHAGSNFRFNPELKLSTVSAMDEQLLIWFEFMITATKIRVAGKIIQ